MGRKARYICDVSRLQGPFRIHGEKKANDAIGSFYLAKTFDLSLHDSTLSRYSKPGNYFDDEAKAESLSFIIFFDTSRLFHFFLFGDKAVY